MQSSDYSPLRQLRMGLLPKMVSWYDPRLLARVWVRTIISAVFGQYADQRLIQAATDPGTVADILVRYESLRDKLKSRTANAVKQAPLLDFIHNRVQSIQTNGRERQCYTFSVVRASRGRR